MLRQIFHILTLGLINKTPTPKKIDVGPVSQKWRWNYIEDSGKGNR